MKTIKAYWWRAVNFGDTLTPIILEHFISDSKVEYTHKPEAGRVVGVGSIAHHAGRGDIIFGSGSNRPSKKINGEGITFLAVRGPLTRKQVFNADVPEVYGDPAILLPLMFYPTVEKKYKLGILPHYVDKPTCPKPGPDEVLLDIQEDWKTLIEKMLECESIISSSLHGIIAAEAYGIPAEWAVWGDKIIGGDYKFHDYFLGTGREKHGHGPLPAIPHLVQQQRKLVEVIATIKI